MGILLCVYAATTLASYLLVGITEAAIDKRLDREGYVDTTRDESTIEKVKSYLEIAIILAIPIFNVAFSSYIFFSDKLYDEILQEGLSNNVIRRKTKEELLIEKEEEILKQEISKKKNGNVLEEQPLIKAYSEMTNEEKLTFLARERNFLLSQNDPQNTHSYNDRGTYLKKRN